MLLEETTYLAFYLPETTKYLAFSLLTTSQIDSNKVLKSKLKPDLCKCVKTEIIESMTPPQQRHKRGTGPNFLAHPVVGIQFSLDKLAQTVSLCKWSMRQETVIKVEILTFSRVY